MSMWDDEAGYNRDDPKHPDWADAAAFRADLDRAAARERLEDVYADDPLVDGPDDFTCGGVA